jgi:magnesium-transporting ATPase (P-type)
LFSAALATLLTVTLPELSPDPQEKTTFYLENIYKLQVQALGDPNTPLPSVPAQPPPFSPPKHAIWVNSLLALSLCINLFTAIVAIAAWRWMSLGILYADSEENKPQLRARVQEVVDYEFRTWRRAISLVVTIMVYLSAWCFFMGISIYGFYLNRIVFAVVFAVGGVCGILFGIFECSLSVVSEYMGAVLVYVRSIFAGQA